MKSGERKAQAKARPFRMTRQRRAILEAVRTSGEHPTADAVYGRVRARLPKISLGTVYRNLETLARAGLIGTVGLRGRRMRFDGTLERHDHIRCVDCGKIADVPAACLPDLDAAARKACGFEILGHALEFQGRCRQCGDQGDS